MHTVGKDSRCNAKIPDAADFIRKIRLMRRLNLNGCFLLISYAAWIAAFWLRGMIGNDSLLVFPLLFLISLPVLFATLRPKFFKRPKCPVCRTEINEETGPMVIASGKCPACDSEILDRPRDCTGELLDRRAFAAYHRLDRALLRTAAAAAGLAFCILTAIALEQFVLSLFATYNGAYSAIQYSVSTAATRISS